MRTRVLLLVLAVGCQDPARPPTPVERTSIVEAPAPAAAPAATPAAATPLRPYAVRFARPCTEWASRHVAATDRHVFACDGAIYDRATGALIEVRRESLYPRGRVGAYTLWESLESWAVLRDDALVDGARVTLPHSVMMLTAAPDGRRAMATTAAGLATLDVVTRTATRLDAPECANASAAAITREGEVRCIVADEQETRLVEVGRPEPLAALGRVRDVAWDAARDRIFVVRAGRAGFLGSDGRELALRDTIDGLSVLDLSPGGDVLVTHAEGTAIWRLDGSDIHVETVYGRHVDNGAFAGDDIVLSHPAGALVWLHRGEPRERHLQPPDAPRGFVSMARAVDGDSATFRGESLIGRGPNDVAAFERRGTLIVVQHSDAIELARFADDASWARMVAERYLDRGAQRWAKHWRDESGRVVRGHTFIGGCERVHLDVLIRERGDVLERWIVNSDNGRRLDPILGAIPADAREIPEATSDRYEGDPSIGSVGG